MNPDYRVLVTGFEPFGSHATNISEEVATAMGGQRTIPCPWTEEPLLVEFETDVLTVDADGAQRTAQRIQRGEGWDAVLHLGLCESCEHPRVERLAHDWLNMRLPDNSGRQVENAVLDGCGHRGCWLDLSIWDASRFPSPLMFSYDAGAYLCNETYHATLKSLCASSQATPTPTPALFLHLPHEDKVDASHSMAFADACLGYMVRPYPVDVTHVVAMCLSRNDSSVFLTQRGREETDASLWEFPGGKCEPNETWREALEREIEEELSLRITAQHPLGTWFRVRGSDAFAIHLVLAAETTDEFTPLLSVHQAVSWDDAMGPSERSWAGRDGEMFAFLTEALKPMS